MFIDTKEAAFVRDLTKPTLENLAYYLRHKELWPAAFAWDYSSCNTCAMGLAWKLGMMKWPCTNVASEAFGIHPEIAKDFFLGRAWPGMGYHNITPDMVADKIEEYLAHRG